MELSELEVTEEYSVLGQKRYVIRIRGSNVSFNIEADNPGEALEKVLKILKK